SCPQLPLRTNGTLASTFDTDVAKVSGKTQHVVLVRAFRWAYSSGRTTTGTFTELSTGSKGTTFDAATNQNDTTSPDRGNYGEAVLNLTDTIGAVTCGQFASTYMKSRSSTSIASALQDRTSTKPALVGDCPNSTLVKAVRNVTANGAFDTTASAKPGDTLEYRLTYANTGTVAATNVVVTDDIQARQTYVSVPGCTGGCTTNGPPVTRLTWNLGTQQPNAAAVVMTFQTKLDSTFPLGTTLVKNVGVVKSDQESSENSNETVTTVNASVNITSTKSATPNPANIGQVGTYTIKLSKSGNIAGTTDVIDDYDEAHITIVPGSISNGGVNNSPTTGKIKWTAVSVPPGTNTVTLTYQGTVGGTFSGGSGSCNPGQFPVVNTVSLSNGNGTSNTLCVNGLANLPPAKPADTTPTPR